MFWISLLLLLLLFEILILSRSCDYRPGSLPIAGRLELDDPWGPIQAKPFHDFIIPKVTSFLSDLYLVLHSSHHPDCESVQGPAGAQAHTEPPSSEEPGAGTSLQLYGSLVPHPGWRAVSYLLLFFFFFSWSQMGVVRLIELMFVNCSEILQWIVH